MNATQKRPITRNREMLACTECRRRKLKCDRNTPCGTCLRRGDGAGCKYQRYSNGIGNERERRIEAEARLEHLELLVQQLAQHDTASTCADLPSSTTSQSSHTDPSHKSNGFASERFSYHGSTHWSAMLDDIGVLRSSMASKELPAEQDNEPDTEDLGSGIALVFGSSASLPLESVLSQYLPSRQEADRLTAAYFRSKAVAAPFIHARQFQRQYQAFWKNPANAPPLWTSILFSICHIATNSLTARNTNSTGEDVSYSTAAAHCLAIGVFFRPRRFAVESLLLWTQSRCFTCLDIPPDLGTIFGLLIRLATRMGYHRDPDRFDLTPFEREMRRRTWSMCMQLDLLISFQMGLPSNVQFPTWDTQPPKNLLDSDFDEDCEMLPPARPDSEITDILFYNAKHKLVIVFEKILRHSLATNDGGTSVEELDSELKRTYAALPENLRPRPMSDSVIDPPYLIVTRLCVYFMYLKCLCVLHRKYVTIGRAESVTSCCQAASELVRCFLDAFEEFQPGGQNESERWFMSSITWNDFLLGAMALCLVLCVAREGIAGSQVDPPIVMDLLRRSQSIFSEQLRRSRDTQRVQKLIDATLARFAMGSGVTQGSGSSDGLALSVETFTSQDRFRSSASNQQPMNGASVQSGVQQTQIDQTDFDWTWDEDMARSMDDASWSYLEQFLNLSNDDLMADF